MNFRTLSLVLLITLLGITVGWATDCTDQCMKKFPCAEGNSCTDYVDCIKACNYQSVNVR
jgi:hypothetical protein